MSNKYFATYDSNGKISSYGSISQGEVTFPSGIDFVTFENPVTNIERDCYVTNETLSTRPTNNSSVSPSSVTANGAEEAVITNIPNPSDVLVILEGSNVSTVEVTDGTLELTFEDAGEYTIKIESFPTKDIELTVTAT